MLPVLLSAELRVAGNSTLLGPVSTLGGSRRFVFDFLLWINQAITIGPANPIVFGVAFQ